MPALSALVASWILLHLLLQTPGTGAIKCHRTETGYQPHSRDCGPNAKGCRIVVKPYKVQNDSAIATCRSSEKPGDYTYDCAVDCPARDKWDWNEVECCKTDNCNSDLNAVNAHHYCYVSKAKSQVYDRIDVCKASQKCALNIQSGDTACVAEADCKSGKWICCTSDKNCGHTWGVYKVQNQPQEEESTDANNLTASLALSVASLLIIYTFLSPAAYLQHGY